MGSKFWEISYPTLTEASTTHPDWDRTLYFGGRQFSTWIFNKGMMEGDGISITGKDGVYLGTIEELGDAESGQNWMTVDLM